MPTISEDPMMQNNLRLKSEIEIVAKALDNSLRKIKIHQRRFSTEPELDDGIKSNQS